MHGFSLAPKEVQSRQPRIQLTGREEVLIEQHTGLFSYETRCIRIRTRMGIVTIKGENLVIAFFGTEDLLIRGRVDQIGMEDQAG
ncbi:MAG: YabP/YqfC family sporulation protein [Clostridia bacterium]|nr:YabP/YqfC family sporulation protein [Clostridia bacterium]